MPKLKVTITDGRGDIVYDESVESPATAEACSRMLSGAWEAVKAEVGEPGAPPIGLGTEPDLPAG